MYEQHHQSLKSFSTLIYPHKFTEYDQIRGWKSKTTKRKAATWPKEDFFLRRRNLLILFFFKSGEVLFKLRYFNKNRQEWASHLHTVPCPWCTHCMVVSRTLAALCAWTMYLFTDYTNLNFMKARQTQIASAEDSHDKKTDSLLPPC